jgi:hypothetical protein
MTQSGANPSLGRNSLLNRENTGNFLALSHFLGDRCCKNILTLRVYREIPYSQVTGNFETCIKEFFYEIREFVSAAGNRRIPRLAPWEAATCTIGQAHGKAEPSTALEMAEGGRGLGRVTLGADKGYGPQGVRARAAGSQHHPASRVEEVESG